MGGGGGVTRPLPPKTKNHPGVSCPIGWGGLERNAKRKTHANFHQNPMHFNGFRACFSIFISLIFGEFGRRVGKGWGSWFFENQNPTALSCPVAKRASKISIKDGVEVFNTPILKVVVPKTWKNLDQWTFFVLRFDFGLFFPGDAWFYLFFSNSALMILWKSKSYCSLMPSGETGVKNQY